MQSWKQPKDKSSQQGDSPTAMPCLQNLLKSHFSERVPLCCIKTYGCQANAADSEKIRGLLAQAGFGFTEQMDQADLVLFNTCAIREKAENHVYGNLGEAGHWKKVNPNLVVAVCGCMAQQQHVADKIKQSYPFVNLVFGTHVLHLLPQMLCRVYSKSQPVVCLSEVEAVHEEMPIQRTHPFKASVPIMYGCDNFCSYCVVPYVRGRERSREMSEILREIDSLIQNGYQEILLLGQNVNSYGKGLQHPADFSELLRQINQIPGEFRIRFMTSHPKDASEQLFKTMAACQKVCRHLHLPVQSGNDRILSCMNRRYTAAHYLQLVETARRWMPDISLTSDIIVGFPGETEQEFQDTLRLIQAVKFDSLYTFAYSSRPGTKAAEMEGHLDAAVKSDRLQRLMAVQEEIGSSQYAKQVGKWLPVLVESAVAALPGYVSGRAENNMIVDFPGDKSLIGRVIPVKITSAKRLALVGSTGEK